MKKQQTPKLMELLDFSLQVLVGLETVSERKINVFNESIKGSSETFSSMVSVMSDEQKEELKIIKTTIKVLEKAKQILCSHPEKDIDTSEGTKYCMNCNITLSTK